MFTLEDLLEQRNATLIDAEKLSSETSAEGVTQEVIDAKTAEMKAKLDEVDELEVQIKEATAKREEADSVRERIKNATRINPARTAQQVDPAMSTIKTKEMIMEDPKRGFKSLVEVAQAVHGATMGTSHDPRLQYLAAAVGMNQGAGPAGGFLVPPSFGDRIWEGMQQDSANIWNKTDNFPVEGESLTFPAVNETTRVNGGRWGGIESFWLNEAGVKTPSNPTFRQVKVEPQELIIFSAITDKLLNNSPIALEQFLNRAAADEIGFQLSNAVVDGDGAGKPIGFLRSNATIEVPKEVGQNDDTVVVQNIERIFSRFPQWRIRNAVWIANQTIMPQLNTMTLGDTPIYLPSNNVAGAPFATIKGVPVMFVEYAKALGSRGDISLVDLSAYFSGTQAGGIAADQSIHFFFDTNQKAFRWVVAVDGKPWINEPLQPLNGDTLSPFVTLAERKP